MKVANSYKNYAFNFNNAYMNDKGKPELMPSASVIDASKAYTFAE